MYSNKGIYTKGVEHCYCYSYIDQRPPEKKAMKFGVQEKTKDRGRSKWPDLMLKALSSLLESSSKGITLNSPS